MQPAHSNWKATVLCAALAWSPAAHAERYALMVAIEDYSSVGANNLPGCRGDLEDLKAVLVRDLKFPTANIQVLVDGQADKSSVLVALRALVAKAGPDDSVLFYWSGHGGQVPDLNDDDETADNLDEVLITSDFDPLEPGTWLLDDHLRAVLSHLRTPRALVLIDACHSGTGTRGDIVNKRLDFGYATMLGRGRVDKDLLEGAKAGPSSHVLIAACAANQVAAMGDYDGKRRSLFTAALVRVLPKALASPLTDLTKALHAEMKRLHPAAARQQDPQLETSARFTLQTLVGDGAVPVPRGERGKPEPVTLPLPEPCDGLPTAFPVAVTTDRRVYKIGDTMVASVVSDKAGFLRLYYVDCKGDATLIFPNFHHRDNWIQGRTRVEVGGPDYPFIFRMKEPGGAEMLLAAVSPVQFSDHDALKFTEVQPVVDMGKVNAICPLVDRGTKAVEVIARPASSSNTNAGSATLPAPIRPVQIGRASCLYQITVPAP